MCDLLHFLHLIKNDNKKPDMSRTKRYDTYDMYKVHYQYVLRIESRESIDI